MRIIIKENIDDFKDDYLDYNEDKYYLVDTFKDFKKYGHKDKHHQGIEAITSNYKELLKDLEKNNIYISDEFKNIKESDLKKENNYFILPYKFTNNIVEQLGYRPNPMRTYKDNKVKYDNNIISDVEFENMILNKNNAYHFVTNWKFKNADIKILTNNDVIFITDAYIYDTIFNIKGLKIYDCEIENCEITNAIIYSCKVITSNIISATIQENSIFINGTCTNCSFENSIWKYGKWRYTPINGVSHPRFDKSIWEDGIWEDGWLTDSTWKKGTWYDGKFSRSTWEKGIWKNGSFINSIWKRGTWNNGGFIKSTWYKGEFNGGSFSGSKWKGGVWVNGTWDISDTKEYINKYMSKKDIGGDVTFFINGNIKLKEILTNKEILLELKEIMIDINIKYIDLASYKLTLDEVDKILAEL